MLQAWKEETGGLLSETGTTNVTSRQMGAGARRRGIAVP